LFLDVMPELGVREVPDPYDGGPDGFERVLDLIERASEALVADIRLKLPG
jgi:protein-tyrosine phosphatase